MASIEGGGGDDHHKKGPGVKKAKKLSTRVDMTPMVDLGFLLITFFIFTTTMSTPTTMNLNMPKETDKKDETKIKMSGALTILLGKSEDNVYYYEGELDPVSYSNFKTATFKEIRDIIIKKKREVVSRYVTNTECEEQAKKDGKPDPKKECEDMDFFVVVKPDSEATYRRIVDILDEMTINVVGRYALVDITEDEDKLVKLTEKR